MSSKFYSYDRRIEPIKYIEPLPLPSLAAWDRIAELRNSIMEMFSRPTIANRRSSYDNFLVHQGVNSCLTTEPEQQL